MITNLQHHSDGSWTWRRGENSRGSYYTNANGEGIFYQSDSTGATRQILGTAQFSACETAGGMRRKLNRLSIFEDSVDDPRI